MPPILARLLSGRRASQPVECDGYFHIVRTESQSLIFRTPTHHEARIARAGASDDQAQRWLGWSEDNMCPEGSRAALLASHADGAERPTVPTLAAQGQLVAIDAGGLNVVGQVGIEATPEGLHVGGWLTPRYRGKGLGRELFAAALVLGHEHLGIGLLRAGAEVANVVSRKSLEAAGFKPVQGIYDHCLPDGRVVPACRYEHVAPGSASSCRVSA